MFAWACALALLGLSALTSCTSRFYYSTNAFRRSDECNLCFEQDCMTLDQARCDYYAEADAVLKEDEEDPAGEEDPVMRKEVDDLVFDLVDKVSGLSNNMDCIPYVSRYTNCNKENACLGCKSCVCDPEGRWNCTIMQPCHSRDQPLNIDHRVLVMVMEALIDSQPHKVKRSVTDSPEDATSSTITLEQLSEWFYGVKPLSKLEVSTTEAPSSDFKATAMDNDKPMIATTEHNSRAKTSDVTNTAVNIDGKKTGDTDYVAFDEVLRSIAVDTKTYNRRKPLDNKFNNQSFDVDYMIMDDDNIAGGNVSDDFAYVVNFMQEDDAEIITESPVGATKIVIDLLETAGRNNNVNVTDDYIGLNRDLDSNAFENTNDIIEYNAVNIMKRDVSSQDKTTTPSVSPTITIIVNTTNTTDTNKTEDAIDLKENILIPLNKIIVDKINELENLKRIKESLLKILKSNGDLPEDIEKENNASETHFSIYNLAMETGLDVDLRRANPNGYDKYMVKLKTDIFEVIRDVVLIQKHRISDVPEDLKLLMHAMKRYVYKNKFLQKPKFKKLKRFRNFRRQMQQSYGRCDFISFKDCLVQVIEVIDKNMPKNNALSPLSPASRKIMRHVILSYYVDENAMPGLRVHDPHYNLTNDLKNIGSQWQGMTNSLLSSSPFVSLYRMKLLHYVLTSDISKMNDALGLVDFAHSRRMLPSLDKVSDDILEKINSGLTAIHNKIQIIIRYYAQRPTSTPNVRTKDETATKPIIEPPDNRNKKNRSFIKHIRTLLKTSKKDIAELLQRKVPKSEIVKQLAKKKLDEISEKRYNEYEETMKRWQKNLELAPRMKRSVLDTFKTRIKNIIPNYLRHKVNPRIKENKKNATATATRKADDRKKKRKALKRERKSKRSTTPHTNVTPRPSPVTTKAPTIKKAATTVKHS